LLFAIVALGLVHGCSSDHSRLAKDGEAGGGGSGGEGGESSSVTVGGSGGTGGIEEPPGPTKLTIVNGVVDYDAARFCFVPYPDGGASDPWPGVAGLAFAHGAAITPIHDVVPDNADVEILVIVGSLLATDGLSCEELVTAPPIGVVVGSLGVLPLSVFDEEKSVLAVPNGCAGGAGHTAGDPALDEKVCGLFYSETTPNLSMAAGFMSRIGSTDKLGLQFAQASQGAGAMQMSVRPGVSGASAQLIVPEWSAGAIAPFPPFQGYATANIGTLDDAALVVSGAMSPVTLASVPWATAFANGTVGGADMTNGLNFTFIAIGAAPGTSGGNWFNAFTFTVVASDP
jgi:hypothetical protein